MAKHILIINGHPIKKSFCEGLAKEYVKGAKTTDATVTQLHLHELKFNPVYKGTKQRLEPDLVKAQKELKKADHIVIVYPIWWASAPSLLQGFFERVLLPGFAYTWEGGFRPKKLLKGKSARIIVTMGDPKLFYEFGLLNSAYHRAIKHGVLGFVGISPVRFSVFGRIPRSTKQRRQKYLRHVYAMGKKLR